MVRRHCSPRPIRVLLRHSTEPRGLRGWPTRSDNSIGQWVAITFDKRIRFSTITVTPSASPVTIDKLRITTDRGTVTRRLASGHTSYLLSVPTGYTRHLRVTIAGTRSAPVSPQSIVWGAGISHIAIPGVSFQPRMLLPDDESARFSSPASRPSVIALNRPNINANLSLGLATSDDPVMGREFTLPRSEATAANGSAVPIPSARLNALLDMLDPVPSGGLDVTASSTLGGLPRFRAENLVDGSKLPWIAEVGDHTPSLHLSWRGSRPIDSVSFTLSSVAARPIEVSITPKGAKSTLASVPRGGGVVTFPKAVADSLVIRFIRVQQQSMVAPNLLVGLTLPVGLSSLSVAGLTSAPMHAPDLNKHFALACGGGPDVQIDGRSVRTSITGTIGDLINLDPLPITACTPSGGLQLSAATHTFEAADPFGPFSVTSFLLTPVKPAETSNLPRRSASVQQWGGETRAIRVSKGPATYIVIAQNFNSSWHASLANQTLKSVRVDGWEQGYLVPAGAAGTVSLTVQANTSFELLLVMGGLLLVGLLLLALMPSRRASPAVVAPRGTPFWLMLGACVAALVLISGPLALVLAPLVLIARRWGPAPLAITAFVAIVAAGIAAAWHPASLIYTGAGAFGRPAQIASVVAFAAVLGSFVADSWKETRSTAPPQGSDQLMVPAADQGADELSNEMTSS